MVAPLTPWQDDSARAGTAATVSIDLLSDSNNTSTTVGAVNSCRALSVGSSITVDAVIQDVSNLSGFQMDMQYDPAVVRVVPLSGVLTLDYNYILAPALTSVLDLGDGLPDDGDGVFTFAAVQFPSNPVSGSGVLVRFKIEAIGAGSTDVVLAGVKLSDGTGTTIQPADANGFYTGPINGATVVVGGGCADLDGDGISDSEDNCPAWYNPDQSLPPWHVPPGDADCDGFDDSTEDYLGTLPDRQCPETSTVDDEEPDAWPPDFNDDQTVSISDVLALKPVFNHDVPPVSQRYDLSTDGTISISDVLMLKPYFNLSCS